ncbi:MAG TPA: baseplate J/gp47 family protein [Chloroflexia bacterium]|nr:baseplate J/gp47 family protein [Chloroflexia bacterium]
MNPETNNLIERPYQEIVDDILTAMVGGVVNEPIFFDVKEAKYPLAQPATGVRGITGTRSLLVDGTRRLLRHTFQIGVDFLFNQSDSTISWLPSGLKPEDETIFYVDYFRRDGRSPLTDINVGSVTRTLGEAVGREIATVYEQLNRAYLSGFVDTATGQSLDLVVSILGVKRKTAEYASGLVTFFRDVAARDGNITIPEGTQLSTKQGEATFVTVQLRTLQRGQVRIDVPVRASDASKGSPGERGAGEITTLAQPITGISHATNLEPTVLGAEDETDEELRARAKATLRGVGKGTLLALMQVILSERAQLAEVWDPNGSPAKQSEPGSVVLLVESEPERFPTLRAAVEETRAAGVQATLVARYVFFKPRMLVKLVPGLTATGKVKVIAEIIAKMQEYVDPLGAGDPAKGEELLKKIKEVKEVTNVRIVDVLCARADLGRPGVEDLVDALVTAVTQSVAGDSVALRESVTQALSVTTSLVPTARRIPDRDLVKGPSGQRATDGEIEAGTFQVVPVVGGEKWWVLLDVEPADIVLQES